MGQRHQAFLIAKIIPHGETEPRYRCIAAIHHQWCYGTLPLSATLRLLKQLRHPDNANIIREELRGLDGKYGRHGVAPKTPPTPAPYSSFLIASAFNLDLEDSSDVYMHLASLEMTLLDANMRSFGGDNNDGITVIDISDPQKPAYCFLLNPVSILTAEDYVRTYYSKPSNSSEASDSEDEGEGEGEGEPEHEKVILDLIGSFKDETLVTIEMLSEAWPREYKVQKQKDVSGKPASNSIDPPSVEVATAVTALSELTLGPAIDHALNIDSIEDIEQLLWLPGKAEAVISILKSRDSLVDNGCHLLAKALSQAHSAEVNFSGWSLSTTQIALVLNNLDKRGEIETIDLSHNQFVVVDTVRTVLELIPTLKRLVLLDTAVTNDDMSSLLRDSPNLFLNMEAITHPLFLAGGNDEDERFPNAFAMFTGSRGGNTDVALASIPVFTPALVVQALSDYLPGVLDMEQLSAFSPSPMAPQAVLSSLVRKDDETWAARTVPMIAAAEFNGALNGNGWFFGLAPNKYQYAFIKTRIDQDATGRAIAAVFSKDRKSVKLDVVQSVEGLRGFLKAMKDEGRPDAPTSAVDALATLLDRWELKVMDAEAANEFIKSLVWSVGIVNTMRRHLSQ